MVVWERKITNYTHFHLRLLGPSRTSGWTSDADYAAEQNLLHAHILLSSNDAKLETPGTDA